MKSIYRAILAACLGTLGSLTVQAQNTAYGTLSLASNTTGSYNAAFGFYALPYNTTGGENTALGAETLYENISGGNNTAVGDFSLSNNISGSFNTATGNYSLTYNMTGDNNAAYGMYSLEENTSGSNNTAFGYGALSNNSNGGYNTAIGPWALEASTIGSNNIAIGRWAGGGLPGSSSGNIDIGSYGGASDWGVIRIGTGGQSAFYASGVYTAGVANGVPVVVNQLGQLGIVSSSIRFKEDVHDMAAASDGLMRLRPVTYRYKQPYADGSKPVDYGLIAEEVAQVYPDLVARDASGQIQTVQYQKLTPMLLNEVQKEHQLLEEQEKTIQLLEKRLAALETAQPSPGSDAQFAKK